MNILTMTDKKINFFLLAIVFTPSLFMMLFKTSSMALSILLIAFSIIVVECFKSVFILNKISNNYFSKVHTVFYLFLFILIHYITNVLIFSKNQDSSKFILSYISFIVIFFSAKLLASSLNTLSYKSIDHNINIIVYFLLCNSIVSLTGTDFIGNATHKPVFLFSEPSHFTLVAGYFLMYYIYFRSIKWFYIGGFFLFWALYIQSFTMLLTLIAILLLNFRVNYMLIFLGVIVSSSLFLLNFNTDYFTSRLIFSVDNANLSTLFLMQGWENAFLSIKETYGLGLGFQQLGTVVTSVGEISEQLNLLSSGELNNFDGGTLAAKIIAECGVIGFIFILNFLKRAYKSFFVLKKIKANKLSNVSNLAVFGHCVNILFIIELFVRGVGYFSPGVFIYLIMYYHESFLLLPNKK
jgi:hypothetical protein